MLRRTFEIAKLYLKNTYKDRGSFIFGILMPLVFTFVIGMGISGFNDEEGDPTWRLDVVDRDQTALSETLVESLSAEPILAVQSQDEETAASNLEAGDSDALLILPSGMSEQLTSSAAVELEFRLNIDDQVSAQVVEQAVLAVVNQLGSSVEIAELSVRVADQLGVFALDNGPTQEEHFDASLASAQARWEAGAPIAVETQQETRREDMEVQIPMGFQQTSPGIAVMFAMFGIVNGAATILLEREQGTLRRLLVTPASKAAILGGKLLGVFLFGAFQFTILVLAGQFLFGVDWGRDPAALAIMVLSFSFSITALAMLFASLVRTYAQVDAVSTLVILPLAGLGGAMWPIEIVPDFMQRAALWLPTGWAMRGFHDIITRGLGFQDVLQEAGVLLAFGVVFLLIGVWRFKYE
jgi:ABC-2 type transport system permease protein